MPNQIIINDWHLLCIHLTRDKLTNCTHLVLESIPNAMSKSIIRKTFIWTSNGTGHKKIFAHRIEALDYGMICDIVLSLCEKSVENSCGKFLTCLDILK